LKFEVAAWGEGFEGFVYHVLRVFEAGEDRTAMDVVESFGEVPFVFCVVDFKTAVWWNTVFRVSGWSEGLVGGNTKVVGLD
jgi:hypothetical protein